MSGEVVAVARDAEHRFSKIVAPAINLVEGLGVEGDAHLGCTVMHRSRVAVDPNQPNLRQVHLLHAELFTELAERGFAVKPADLGENITTRHVDLLALPRGAILRIGPDVELEVTGLRNPCAQIENFQKGLLTEVLLRGDRGVLVRKAVIMAVVRSGGLVKASDSISVSYPPPPWLPLERV